MSQYQLIPINDGKKSKIRCNVIRDGYIAIENSDPIDAMEYIFGVIQPGDTFQEFDLSREHSSYIYDYHSLMAVKQKKEALFRGELPD